METLSNKRMQDGIFAVETEQPHTFDCYEARYTENVSHTDIIMNMYNKIKISILSVLIMHI